MAKFGGRSVGMHVFWAVVGAVIGGLLGQALSYVEAFSGIAPYLVASQPIFETSSISVNLFILKFVFSFSFLPNIMSAVGIIVALLLARKY